MLVLDAIRKRLLADMRAAFSEGTFGAAYPRVPVPQAVTVGGDPEQPPFEVIVRELPQLGTGTKAISCPVVSMEMTWQVDLVCSGADVEDASLHLIAYIDCVFQALMADPSIGGLVQSAVPSITQLGTGYDGDGVVAGALIQVDMVRDWPRNKTVFEAVKAA